MSWLASVFVALLTGALGLVLGGLIGGACVEWYRISGFEGGSCYFMAAIALLGGFAGLVIGAVASRWVGGDSVPGFLKGLGLPWVVVVGIAGIAALVSWSLADVPPKIDGHHLTLEVE